MKESLTAWADFAESNNGEAAYKFISDQGYKSTVDFPAAALSMDMFKYRPNSKIILGVRDSPEAWYQSAIKTILVCSEPEDIKRQFDRMHPKWYLDHMKYRSGKI